MDKATIDGDRVSWTAGDREVAVRTDLPQAAAAYPAADLVLVLCGPGRHGSVLRGFSVDGSPRFEVGAPEGCWFYYPSRDPAGGPAVVCLSEEAPGGFDARFSVDPDSGSLAYLGLAR